MEIRWEKKTNEKEKREVTAQMGFWSDLQSAFTAFDEMNRNAISDAARLSTDELCQKVNSVSPLANPLIYSACTDELTRRAKAMSKSELFSYFDEYEKRERSDAKDILNAELNKRGIYLESVDEE